jgi:urease accessory protein
MSTSTRTRRTITPDAMSGWRGRVARVAVEADAEGRVRWSALDSGHTIAPRPIWCSGGTARVALVGIAMMMLAGDDVRIDVSVGEGVTLEVIEPAALVAHRSDGRPCSWSMTVTVGAGGGFCYDGAPLVAADGSDIARSMDVALGSNARVLLRETIVLGRAGERGGLVRATTSVGDDDGELFTETLDAGSECSRLPGILGGARVVDSVIAVGWNPRAQPIEAGLTVLDLESPGRIIRALAEDTAATGRSMSAAYTSWRDERRHLESV